MYGMIVLRARETGLWLHFKAATDAVIFNLDKIIFLYMVNLGWFAFIQLIRVYPWHLEYKSSYSKIKSSKSWKQVPTILKKSEQASEPNVWNKPENTMEKADAIKALSWTVSSWSRVCSIHWQLFAWLDQELIFFSSFNKGNFLVGTQSCFWPKFLVWTHSNDVSGSPII